MKMINQILKRLSKFFKPSTHLFVFLNELGRNKELVEDSSYSVSEGWRCFEYVFKDPVSLWFSMKGSSGETQILYNLVYKIVLVEFSNVFVDCRLYFTDRVDVKQFYILNDIYVFEFEIREN